MFQEEGDRAPGRDEKQGVTENKEQGPADSPGIGVRNRGGLSGLGPLRYSFSLDLGTPDMPVRRHRLTRQADPGKKL